MSALTYLLSLAGQIIVALFLLRFLLQLTRADYRNPVSLAIARFTNPVVLPLRRVVPGWRGMDMASLVAALLAQFLVLAALSLIGAMRMPGLAALAIDTPFQLVLAAIQLYTVLIFVRILFSWIDPAGHNPLNGVLYSLTEPLLRPARRLLPALGGLDLSPILVLVGLTVLSILISKDLRGLFP
jgi:YggT family protein